MMRRIVNQILTALQFLTRLPLAPASYDAGSLASAAGWFPFVGLLIGAGALAVHTLAARGLPPLLAALVTVVFLVVITGALHEDGLADTADGLGGGWTREQALRIMRDSRIGSYGAIALILSLLARVLLLASLRPAVFGRYLVAAHVLCRWSTLPLSSFLRPAREQDGQGSRVAQQIPRSAFLLGSLFTAVAVGVLLGSRWWLPASAALLVTALSGFYFQRRLGGITGDCFGAANNLAEIAVYLCGVWQP
ncbi:MAG TPA: adenosylcobinamide-GDP ribazoletransferase [Acidobacteriaceae bacterium]|nr:adenosylcobinamide-GDP ribazoletransferase [Acidobacteriaceae bacterium]